VFPLTLIDRDEPWTLASRALSAACARRGGVVLFQGTGGFGKTALLGALKANGEQLGMDVLSAAGRRHERDFGFGVVLQLFEARLTQDGEEERASLLSGSARQALPLFEAGPRSVEPSFDVLHAVFRLCAKLAARGPVLFAVDDVDLVDEASLRFLLHLVGRLDDLPVAVALTAGSAPPGQVHPLVAELARHPATRRAALGPLSAEGTARRVHETWLPTAPEGACRAIHDASAGNPFLIDEIAGALVAGNGSAGLTGTAVRVLAPESVSDWALTQATMVHPAGPALLKTLAIFGRGAELRHVAGLARLDSDQAATIADGLIEVGLLGADEPLSFSQPVVGTAIAASLSPIERATLHRRASRILASEDAPAQRIAAHLVAATRTGSGWAVEALCEAAAASLGAGRPADAVRYLRRALDEPPPRRLRAHVVFELGCAEATAGEPEAARRLSEAVDSVTAVPEQLGSALDAGRALLALGRQDEAKAIFDLALENAGEEDDELSGRLRAARASTALFGEPDPRGRELLGQIPDAADHAGKRALLAVHAMDGAIRGRPSTEVRELAERALARGALLEDETADGPVYYLPAFALSIAEDLQTAEAALTAAVEDARTRGSVLGFANASHMRSVAILLRGRIPDAAADARQALAVERHGWRLSLSGARVVLSNCLIERGDFRAARRHLSAAEGGPGEHAATRSTVLITRARLAFLEGDVEGALADYRRCGELGTAGGADNPSMSPWRSGAAIALAVLGQTEEANELAERELELAEAFGAPGPIGRTLRTIGMIRGPEAGLEALEAAVQQLESSQAALERARALVEFGAALRRSGRRRDAREPLRLGLDLAQRCGAEALVARAKNEAKTAGARPRRTAVSGVDALTERERQVALLAARGLSNRQIADHLVVTVKTVEWHLAHSFRKLDVDSREKLRDLLAS
jgi:DNA-binding CsgD family transcriptional regulator/predicted negative regulator of RcsB-dependent stress response